MAVNRPKRKRPVVSYQEPELSDTEDSGYSTVTRYDDDNAFHQNPKSQKRVKPSPQSPKTKKKRKKEEKKRRIFPFFRLPRELRDQIYEMALIDQKGILMEASTSLRRRVPHRLNMDGAKLIHNRWSRARYLTSGKIEQLSPNLLRTCRAVYEEALPILYGQPITFVDTKALHNFLSVAGPSNIALL